VDDVLVKDGETHAVPEPVGCGGEGNATGTDGQGEDLADDDPGTRTPGGGEEEDVDADKGDHGLDGGWIIAGGDADDGDDELADGHANGTVNQERATTKTLNSPE